MTNLTKLIAELEKGETGLPMLRRLKRQGQILAAHVRDAEEIIESLDRARFQQSPHTDGVLNPRDIAEHLRREASTNPFYRDNPQGRRALYDFTHSVIVYCHSN